MIKWLKARSRQEKVMMIIIVMLVIGIVLRWGWIKKEAGDAFKSRVERANSSNIPNIMPENADSTGTVGADSTAGELNMQIYPEGWGEGESVDIDM